MSDISEFLQAYNETLQSEMAGVDMPQELSENYTFDSCVKRQDGQEVYFISRNSDGKRAVLRVTDAGSGGNAAAESAVLQKLDHPAIPKWLGTWEHSGRVYMAREHFDGDDLYTYIRKHGPLGRDMLTDISLQLCDILAYIHSQNPAVIHRDIKPENIIIAGNDGVKLIDFGIARDFKPDTEKDTQIAGTRPYMAPEQFGSEATDNRADIYSLGVVMVYMAAAKPDLQRLKADFPHKELTAIIEKCVRKDRDQRYRTAAALKSKILWVRRGMTRKILLCAVVCVLIAAAFLSGLHIGRGQGFKSGVASIMDIPAVNNRPFTQEELSEPVTFNNRHIDMAVRNALNRAEGEPIYRDYLIRYIDELQIFGTYIYHPSLGITFDKKHVAKGVVTYMTSNGFTVDMRGDISSLEDIPNLYYLKTLSLTSQNISDISPLGGMKLENINLADNYVGNLLPLKDMAMLRTLDLCQNPVQDLTPISRLLSLESLDISQTQVTDLSPLKELAKLKTLKLNYCDITDLSPLIRPGNPITVYCEGLAAGVVDRVRDNSGIILVED